MTSCSILSLIGTTALAIVAVWQTEKSNKQNEALIAQNNELQKINDKQFMVANQENYPMIQITKTIVEQYDSCLFSPETNNFCSVTSMGGYVFSNCSELTIYCEAESEPSGWDRKWNSLDGGSVIWGYKKQIES